MTIHKKGKLDSRMYLMKNFGQSVTQSLVKPHLEYSTGTGTLMFRKN